MRAAGQQMPGVSELSSSPESGGGGAASRACTFALHAVRARHSLRTSIRPSSTRHLRALLRLFRHAHSRTPGVDEVPAWQAASMSKPPRTRLIKPPSLLYPRARLSKRRLPHL